MATYERGAGAHAAERIRPTPGSDDEVRLDALSDDPSTDWRRVDDEAPTPVTEDPTDKLPARSASKADWKAYAASQGMDEDEAEKATRDELAAKYADGGDS